MRPIPKPLFVLAMDHRATFRAMYGRQDESPDAQGARFAAGKGLIFEALKLVLGRARMASRRTAVLVDEPYGGAVARAASDAGCLLYMPVEVSHAAVDFNDAELEFEFGDAFGDHLARFPLDGVKILLVHSPAMSEELRERHAERCRRVMRWTVAHGVTLIIELLVPPSPEQLAQCGGSSDRFRAAMHADLVCEAVRDLQGRGVEPDAWKLEPLPSVAAYRAVSGVCRDGGRNDVACVLLGGGASIEMAAQWVADIRGVEGFNGFAIGRSIWQEPLRAYFDGASGDEETTQAIGARIERLVAAYQGT